MAKWECICSEIVNEHLTSTSQEKVYRQFIEFCSEINLSEAPKEKIPSGRELIDYCELRDFGMLSNVGDTIESNTTLFHHIHASKIDKLLLSNKTEQFLHALFYGPKNLAVSYLVELIGSNYADLAAPYFEAVWKQRSVVLEIIECIPRSVLRDEALFKFVRTFLGVIVSAQYYHAQGYARPLDQLYVVDLAIAYGAGFSIADNMFDNSEVVKPNDRGFFCNSIISLFRQQENEMFAPQLPVLKPLREVLERLIKHPQFVNSLPNFEAFTRSQFDSNQNARLVYKSPTTEDLLYSTVMQAGLTRAVVASALGVDERSFDFTRFFDIGTNNQLTNDFAGAFIDRNNMHTLFSNPRYQSECVGFIFRNVDIVAKRRPHKYDVRIRSLLFLRLLEVINELEKRSPVSESTNLLASWFSPHAGKSLQADLQKINEARGKIGRLHKEYAALQPTIYFFQKSRRILSRRRDVCERILKSSVDRYGVALEKRIYTAADTKRVRYPLGPPASRVRSYIALEMLRRLGADVDTAITYASAIELFHTASLIVDDLPSNDNCDLRRNRDSMHRKFGESTAILTSIELVSKAYNLLAHVCSGRKTSRIIELCDDRISGRHGIIEGQIADLYGRKCGQQSVRQYLEVNLLKSGLPFSFVLEGVCLLSDHENCRQPLGRLGRRWGLLYQLADDLRDGDFVSIDKESILRVTRNIGESVKRDVTNIPCNSSLKAFLRAMNSHLTRRVYDYDNIQSISI